MFKSEHNPVSVKILNILSWKEEPHPLLKMQERPKEIRFSFVGLDFVTWRQRQIQIKIVEVNFMSKNQWFIIKEN